MDDSVFYLRLLLSIFNFLVNCLSVMEGITSFQHEYLPPLLYLKKITLVLRAIYSMGYSRPGRFISYVIM